MTPQGQAPAAAPPPGWFSRNWKWLLAVGLLVPMLCCGSLMALGVLGALVADPDGARVDCGTPGPGGVECEVKRTTGTTAFKACWDLEIVCVNEGKMVGHACADFTAGQEKGTVTMPVAAFSNQDGCDAPASGTVTNLTVQTVE